MLLRMADLEELAVKRDRGYLVRLIVMLALAVGASVFVFRGVTGQQTTGCIAGMFLGSGSAPQQPEPRK